MQLSIFTECNCPSQMHLSIFLGHVIFLWWCPFAINSLDPENNRKAMQTRPPPAHRPVFCVQRPLKGFAYLFFGRAIDPDLDSAMDYMQNGKNSESILAHSRLKIHLPA
jgi:hypothetical protein